MIHKKTCLLADACSPDFMFPLWRRYYGGLFGDDNLHILTYVGRKALFDNCGVKVIGLERAYDDKLRAEVISNLVGMLLRQYNVVLRCDIDEFIVPLAGKYRDLADFVDRNDLPYVTARGTDVIEMPGDLPLDLDIPVLPQRSHGLRATALYKTCLTTVPLVWGGGFHGMNLPPVLDDLYLFHLKWADLRRLIAWHETMRPGVVPGSETFGYFNVGAAHLAEHQAWLANKPCGGGETEAEFDRRFLANVGYWQDYGLYQGSFLVQDFLHRIDPAFHAVAPGF